MTQNECVKKESGSGKGTSDSDLLILAIVAGYQQTKKSGENDATDEAEAPCSKPLKTSPVPMTCSVPVQRPLTPEKTNQPCAMPTSPMVGNAPRLQPHKSVSNAPLSPSPMAAVDMTPLQHHAMQPQPFQQMVFPSGLHPHPQYSNTLLTPTLYSAYVGPMAGTQFPMANVAMAQPMMQPQQTSNAYMPSMLQFHVPSSAPVMAMSLHAGMGIDAKSAAIFNFGTSALTPVLTSVPTQMTPMSSETYVNNINNPPVNTMVGAAQGDTAWMYFPPKSEKTNKTSAALENKEIVSAMEPTNYTCTLCKEQYTFYVASKDTNMQNNVKLSQLCFGCIQKTHNTEFDNYVSRCFSCFKVRPIVKFGSKVCQTSKKMKVYKTCVDCRKKKITYHEGVKKQRPSAPA
eukprot:Colp12_sorted_trinity150504_noHs@2529